MENEEKAINNIGRADDLGVSKCTELISLMESTNYKILARLLELETDQIILSMYATDGPLSEEQIVELKSYSATKSTLSDLRDTLKSRLEEIVTPIDKEDMEDVRR